MKRGTELNYLKYANSPEIRNTEFMAMLTLSVQQQNDSLVGAILGENGYHYRLK